MFLRLRVTSFTAWKAVFDEQEPTRRQYGVTGHSLHRDPMDPRVLIVALRVNDVVRAREFAASDRLRQAMVRGGVRGQPEIWLGDDIEDKSYE
jgi:hypothetical protein